MSEENKTLELKDEELQKVSGGNGGLGTPLGTLYAGECYQYQKPQSQNNEGCYIYKVLQDTPYYSLEDNIPCNKYWPTVLFAFGGPVYDEPTAGYLLSIEKLPSEMTCLFN